MSNRGVMVIDMLGDDETIVLSDGDDRELAQRAETPPPLQLQLELQLVVIDQK